MKLGTLYLAVIAATLNCSCQSISTKANAVTQAVTNQASAATGVNLSSLSKTEPVELKVGMSKEDIRSLLGKPSFQYVLSENETWVYTNCNFVVDKAKETALNMVPLVGPAATLFMDLKSNTETAKSLGNL